MAAAIMERFDSRDSEIGAEQSTRSLKYTVINSENEIEVEGLVQATIPAFYRGLQFQSFRQTHQGGGTWDIEVRYASRQIKDVGQSSFTFDTTGGTQKLKFSKRTTTYVPSLTPEDVDPIDFAHGINVQPDGKVEGVEIQLPKFGFTITRVLADPLPQYYVTALEALQSCVNADHIVLVIGGVIYYFEPGELLFLGSTGSKRGTDAWEITLRCEVSRNVGNVGFGLPDLGDGADTITVDVKLGWDYLWVYTQEYKIGSSLVSVPVQVMVEQVYDYQPLSILFL